MCASHHAVDVARIADDRPVADTGNWHIEKHFGQRCSESGVTFELRWFHSRRSERKEDGLWLG